jgi:hypothetical protein
MPRTSIGSVIQALATPYPDYINPDTPDCSLAAAGGRCTYLSSQILGAVATVDLFTITGAVRILQIYGCVTAEAEAPNVAFSATKFSIYDQTNTVDMCTSVDASGIEVGDVLLKQAANGSPLVWLDSDNAGIYSEGGALSKSFFEGVAVAKQGAATVVRFSYTGDANTDVTIFFAIRWQPMDPTSRIVTI